MLYNPWLFIQYFLKKLFLDFFFILEEEDQWVRTFYATTI